MNIRAKVFGTNDGIEPSPIVEAKTPRGARADQLGSIAVKREEARRANTRGGDRHRLDEQQVRVHYQDRPYDVRLVNLSGGGAMVEADFSPMLWDRIDLHLGEGGTIECAVRWLRGSRIGLEFAHETRLDCTADQQAALLRDTIAESFPDLEFEPAGPFDATADADPGDEQRRARRHPLIWSGQIHHDYESSPVRLRNISESGAAIETEARLRVGAEPLLDLGDAGTAFATVSWVVGDQAGLKFHQPFDLSQLARGKPTVAPAHWEAPSYLQPDGSTSSPWSQPWGRMSLGELRDEMEGYLKR